MEFFESDILRYIFSFLGVAATFYGVYKASQAVTRKKEKEWEEKDQTHELEIRLIIKDLESLKEDVEKEFTRLREEVQKSYNEQEKFDDRLIKRLDKHDDKIDGILTNIIEYMSKK